MDIRLKTIGGILLNVLLPRTCAHCGEDLPRGPENPLCAGCMSGLDVPAPPICGTCGLPDAGGLCRNCRSAPPPFDLARSAFLFDAKIRSLVHSFKYSDRPRLARPLALMMAAGLARYPELSGFGTVVPVPLHPSRERRRGYNQAELLGRELADVAGLEFDRGIVVRTRETAPQVGLGRKERAGNVMGAFSAGPGARGRRFLVVDDVATTLATAGGVCAALKEAGAESAAVFTLAREP